MRYAKRERVLTPDGLLGMVVGAHPAGVVVRLLEGAPGVAGLSVVYQEEELGRLDQEEAARLVPRSTEIFVRGIEAQLDAQKRE